MLQRFLMAGALVGAVSVGSLGLASKAEAYCGGGYYGGYSAYYGPAYGGPYYPGYTVAYPAIYPYPYGPYGYPQRYHHHRHNGVVVSFGY